MTERIDLYTRFRDILEILKPTPAGPPTVFRVPNLECRQPHGVGIATQWHIEVTVENTGNRSSNRQCEVLAILWSVDGQQIPLVASCPPLAPGETHVVVFPNSGVSSYDIQAVTVLVDPPTIEHPGGQIWELNNNDNLCVGTLNRLPTDPSPPKDPDGASERQPPPKGPRRPDPPFSKG
jgi:hypothetical protein